MISRKAHIKLCIFIALFLGMLITGFQGDWQTPPDQGQKLAKQYCSSCHQFPDPSILTKRSWKFLLTDMGFRLGIVDYSAMSDLPPVATMHMTTRENILREAEVVPGAPLISQQEWSAIRKYYQQEAPKQPLPQLEKPTTVEQLDQFEIKFTDYQPKAAIFTLMRVDPHRGGLILNNIRDQTMVILDKHLKLTAAHHEPEILVDVAFNKEKFELLAIGDLMGRYIGIGKGSIRKRKIPGYTDLGLTVEKLHRPADMEYADVDGDGTQEVIVCNFGDMTGNVSIYRPGEAGKELVSEPGAIRSQVFDFNQDGLQDIIVLMGDARENISILYNQGNNEFTRERVVETHSAYGHTYFELQDFNQDGHLDILAVNGDTDADPFNTLKNYHGIRIYLNDRSNHFKLGYFYPMYGAHFAKAADFDQDGDLDIAASAFFPDFSSDKPEQFVYLENRGNLKFQPFTHPETYHGRWMTLDIGDYDLDGDTDVVLGGGYLPLGMEVDFPYKYQTLAEKGKALVVFENKLY